MKPTFFRVLYNIAPKTVFPGYRIPILSCRRCMSYTATNEQQLEKSVAKGNVQTEDKYAESMKHEDYFNVRDLVTLNDLFNYKAHIGHNKGCRNVYMTPYLFGNRSDIDIIDLEQTVPLFQDALNFTAHIAYRGGIILFVNRNKGMLPSVEKTADACGEYAHCRYWQPGLFTTMYNRIGQRIRLPDLVIILNSLNSSYEQHRAVVESAKMLIPTVGIVDSNCDPRLITYPIPANDDSFKTMSYYLNLFESAIMAGKKKRGSEIMSQETSQNT